MLSKSTYLRGHQCLKRLWLHKRKPELRDDYSAQQEALFAQGTSVGELAQQLFPGGKDATPENYYDWKPAFEKTKKWIEQGEEVIYEAAFSFGNVMAALDILVRKDGEWHAIEVKSSTGVHEYHKTDCSLQYWVMNLCGITPDKFFLMHINNQYVRKGQLDVEELFTLEDITQEVLDRQSEVQPYLTDCFEILKEKKEPEIQVGHHCSDPFGCDFMGHCWKHVPNYSVFNITRIGAKGWDLYEKGIYNIKDVPNDYPLSEKQTNQVLGEKTRQEVFIKDEIAPFIGGWEYPLYFFDFETIGPAIPIYDGTRPYEQYPFQYSLHVLAQNGTVNHYEFLGNGKLDPRINLIDKMIRELGRRGSIVTYNMGFEKGKIKALAEAFPMYAEPLLEINKRVVDLIIPFRKHWYYKPEMQGSASIKKVLPALIPNLSYSDLEIQEGGTASATYLAMCEGTFKGDVQKTRKDLLEYCKLDTWAMVEIYWHLKARLDE